MAQEYVLRDTLTYTIEKLNHSIHDLQSRVIECESKIAQLNNQVYNIQYGRNIELRDRMDELALDFNDLKCQIVGEVAELRANLDAWVVKPNEKSNLEILEQNDRNELKYIDLDEVNKEKGFWDLYDDNWWNK